MKEVGNVSLVYRRLASPVGELKLFANEDALVAVNFPSRHNHTRGTPNPEAREVRHHAVLDLAAGSSSSTSRDAARSFTLRCMPRGPSFSERCGMR